MKKNSILKITLLAITSSIYGVKLCDTSRLNEKQICTFKHDGNIYETTHPGHIGTLCNAFAKENPAWIFIDGYKYASNPEGDIFFKDVPQFTVADIEFGTPKVLFSKHDKVLYVVNGRYCLVLTLKDQYNINPENSFGLDIFPKNERSFCLAGKEIPDILSQIVRTCRITLRNKLSPILEEDPEPQIVELDFKATFGPSLAFANHQKKRPTYEFPEKNVVVVTNKHKGKEAKHKVVFGEDGSVSSYKWNPEAKLYNNKTDIIPELHQVIIDLLRRDFELKTVSPVFDDENGYDFSHRFMCQRSVNKLLCQYIGSKSKDWMTGRDKDGNQTLFDVNKRALYVHVYNQSSSPKQYALKLNESGEYYEVFLYHKDCMYYYPESVSFELPDYVKELFLMPNNLIPAPEIQSLHSESLGEPWLWYKLGPTEYAIKYNETLVFYKPTTIIKGYKVICFNKTFIYLSCGNIVLAINIEKGDGQFKVYQWNGVKYKASDLDPNIRALIKMLNIVACIYDLHQIPQEIMHHIGDLRLEGRPSINESMSKYEVTFNAEGLRIVKHKTKAYPIFVETERTRQKCVLEVYHNPDEDNKSQLIYDLRPDSVDVEIFYFENGIYQKSNEDQGFNLPWEISYHLLLPVLAKNSYSEVRDENNRVIHRRISCPRVLAYKYPQHTIMVDTSQEMPPYSEIQGMKIIEFQCPDGTTFLFNNLSRILLATDNYRRLVLMRQSEEDEEYKYDSNHYKRINNEGRSLYPKIPHNILNYLDGLRESPAERHVDEDEVMLDVGEMQDAYAQVLQEFYTR